MNTKPGTRALRLEAGLSQRQLAAAIGSRQGAIARLEAGRVSPTLRTLERIGEALGYDLEVVWSRKVDH